MSYVCRNQIAGLWGVLLLIALAGCSSPPSDIELATALTNGDTLIGQVYEIRDIRRLNGYEQSDGYIVEYAAKLHILESPLEYFKLLTQSGNKVAGALSAYEIAAGGLSKWGLKGAAIISASKKGDDIPISGSVNMIKSERGWIARPG